MLNSGERLVLTIDEVASATTLTTAAAPAEESDTDALANLPSFNAAAERVDSSHRLVARYARPLDRKQAVEYLDTRARQKFTVIQAVALAEFDGLTVPNFYGKLPLIDKDPTRPAITPGANPAKAAE